MDDSDSKKSKEIKSTSKEELFFGLLEGMVFAVVHGDEE